MYLVLNIFGLKINLNKYSKKFKFNKKIKQSKYPKYTNLQYLFTFIKTMCSQYFLVSHNINIDWQDSAKKWHLMMNCFFN